MRGALITICSVTQIGKDHIAKLIKDTLEEKLVLQCYTKESIEVVDGHIIGHELETYDGCKELSETKVVSPTIYKVRKKRKNDDENIVCVDSEEQIPEEFNLRYKIYGTQTTAYNQQEITKLLEAGNIVILTLGSVKMAEQLKEIFGEDCLSVRVSGAYGTEEMIREKEAERRGISPDDPSLVEFAKNRFDDILRLVAELVEYQADFNVRNWWTYPGGKYLATGPHDITKDINSIAGAAYCKVLDSIEKEIAAKNAKKGTKKRHR